MSVQVSKSFVRHAYRKCRVEKRPLCACSVSEERVGTWDHSHAQGAVCMCTLQLLGLPVKGHSWQQLGCNSG